MNSNSVGKGFQFAKIRFREDQRCFGLYQKDRLGHLYIIGKTGTGKTTLLETMISKDIEQGSGIALLDPHGDLAERIYSRLPTNRKRDCFLINLADPNCPYSYNPLTRISVTARPLVASGLMDVFRMMWSDAWGPRMEHILRNALLALLDQPKASLPDILKLMSDKPYRFEVVRNIQNEQVRLF